MLTRVMIWISVLIFLFSYTIIPVNAQINLVTLEYSDLSTNSIKPGETLTIYYHINNPTSQTFTVWLGASIRHSSTGMLIHNPPNDKPVTVNPGRSVQERSFEIPFSAPNGSYDYLVALWDGKPPNKQQFYKSNWSMNAFSVEALSVQSYKVDIDGNEFEIPWSMETGKVSLIEVDKQSKTVTIMLERSETKEDNLLITLPTKLIDTSETELTITANGNKVSYEETHRGTARVLEIPLPSDATSVQISGTYIIPEFPTAPMAIMGTIIATVIVLNRFREA